MIPRRIEFPHGPARRRAGHRAFSLVEVAIAIAIFAFSFAVVIGLMGVGLNADHSASADTQLALMTETMTSILENQGFANVSTNTCYVHGVYVPGTTPTLCFDDSGHYAVSSGAPNFNASPAPTAVYGCTVTVQKNPASANLLNIQLNFAWPVTAPTPTRRTVNMTLVNHDN